MVGRTVTRRAPPIRSAPCGFPRRVSEPRPLGAHSIGSSRSAARPLAGGVGQYVFVPSLPNVWGLLVLNYSHHRQRTCAQASVTERLVALPPVGQSRSATMADILSGDPTSPSIRPPTCPDCGTPMRLQSASPDLRYINLQHMIFMCDCGRASDQLVASE
jgi:hypothetical protein